MIYPHQIDLIRLYFNLNPRYCWAVENYIRMAEEIPGFEAIYLGRPQARYIVHRETTTHVQLEIIDDDGRERLEWHRRDFYYIIPPVDITPV